jgi:hypothetical protein
MSHLRPPKVGSKVFPSNFDAGIRIKGIDGWPSVVDERTASF